MVAYNGAGKGCGKDRTLWLEAYNGGSRSIDRIGRGSFVVPNWSVCMLGGIQPDLIRSVASSLGDDGLLIRTIDPVLRTPRAKKRRGFRDGQAREGKRLVITGQAARGTL